MKEGDTGCRACGEKESQLHLITCDILREEFWSRLFRLMTELEITEPEDETAFMITGQFNEKQTIDNKMSVIIFIAFRCLYAEIVRSREEQSLLDLDKAYTRTISMIVGRVRAYGQKWKRWANKAKNREEGIPQKHANKGLLEFEADGSHEIAPRLLEELKTTEEEARVRAQKIKEEKAREKQANKAEQRRDMEVEEEEGMPETEQPQVEDNENEREKTDIDTQPERDIEIPQQLDEHRDMSGDAITATEALQLGTFSQCTLSATRNIRRNEHYTKERLSELCIDAAFPGDIRCPDWPRILSPLLRRDEEVKRAGLHTIPAEDMDGIRIGVIYGFFHGVYNHVIAIINDDDGGFRVYDNDSPQRQRGTYQSMRADEVTGIPGNMMTLVAITRMGTDISDRMGGAILTLQPARKRRRDG